MLIELFKKSMEHAREQEISYWKCKKCGATASTQAVKDHHYACPSCGGYVRIHAYRRIHMLADEGSFEEWNRELEAVNPLDFPGYERKIWESRESSKLNEAIVTGKISLDGIACAIGVCDARYMMSSMGHNMGEKIARMAERAAEEKIPVILFACSGGARMQEGIISLMQMTKTAQAFGKLKKSGQLFVSVLTDPTMGGVTASFAMLGDIILAEPGALIGFTGARVIRQTIGGKLPENFQRAEFQLEHGFVDAIVEREKLKEILSKILRFHVAGATEFLSGEGEKEAFTMPDIPEMLWNVGSGSVVAVGAAANAGMRMTSQVVTAMRKTVFGEMGKDSTRRNRVSEQDREAFYQEEKKEKTAWETVKLSRDKNRAHALDYIHALFPDFLELHGDRCFGDDRAVTGGIASFHGIPVTVIGIQKGSDFNDNKMRNFGMPNPEGYRKAKRLIKQAEQFKRPVICFVDTPGAYCGIGAEERGQGEAIANNLQTFSELRVPVLSIIIGEGSSGGALGLATADEVWMMENAVYSILSPEGFAAILYRDAKQCELAAESMKMTSADLLRMGVIEKVIPEEEPVRADRIADVAARLDAELIGFIGSYCALSPEELLAKRYARFRKF